MTDHGGDVAHLLGRAFHAHDSRDFIGHGRAADRTSVDRRFTRDDRIGQGVAASKAATAAVGAWQGVANLVALGIGGDFKHLVGNRQQKAENQAKSAQGNGAGENFVHGCAPPFLVNQA